jgi:SpoIID/LytB domain protein
VTVLLSLGAYAVQEPETGAVVHDADTVRIRLTARQREISFTAMQPTALASDKSEQTLPPGTYAIKLSEAHAAKQRFHLFVKTFQSTESAEALACVESWKQQGYAPELVTFGRPFRTDAGKAIDGHGLWVSLARLDSMEKAAALKAKLEPQQVWGWIVPETVERGKGRLTFKRASGKTAVAAEAPARIHGDAPLEIRDLDFGFWQPQRANRSYSGALEIAVGPDGLIEIYETLPMEDYLAGVLPAEMPAAWPMEALEAQAVSARSEILASLGGKHMLEGFDFCGTEHCRAYLGAGGRESNTDRAVRETAGVVLVSGGRIVPTVFSANCGGWTEDNECVWSAPPNPALRAVPDFPEGKKPNLDSQGMAAWLKSSPKAYCREDAENFRWVRKFTARELRDTVNRKYPVGDIRGIELGDRGAGGRLKWVKIVGSRKTEVVRKELNIRLAFGGLKSAMFVVETQGEKGRPASFSFVGGGRGHGVGLCQAGACGMARAGANHRDMLRHYFANTEQARVQ